MLKKLHHILENIMLMREKAMKKVKNFLLQVRLVVQMKNLQV